MIDGERLKNKKRKAADGEIDWDDYHDLDAIYAWIDKLAAQHPDILSVRINGYSAEGRPIKMITLSKKQVNDLIFLINPANSFSCYLIGQSSDFIRRNNTRP